MPSLPRNPLIKPLSPAFSLCTIVELEFTITHAQPIVIVSLPSALLTLGVNFNFLRLRAIITPSILYSCYFSYTYRAVWLIRYYGNSLL
jgi:hypothetical protein